MQADKKTARRRDGAVRFKKWQALRAAVHISQVRAQKDPEPQFGYF